MVFVESRRWPGGCAAIAVLVGGVLLLSCAPGDGPRRAPSLTSVATATLEPSESAPGLESSRLDAEARRAAVDVRIAPSSRGVLGAWLVAGPFRPGRPALQAAPVGLDESALAPISGSRISLAAPSAASDKKLQWRVASSADGPRDLRAALDAPASDRIAYAAGTIHLEQAGRYFLLLSVDDGVRVSVDGRVVLARDDERPLRDDDDVVPLDLAAGEHSILLKLHQRNGPWTFRVRLVDASLNAPRGAYLQLPGTRAEDAHALAARMSSVSFERSFDGTGQAPRYRPKITVRFPEGAPRGVPLSVRTRVGDPGKPPFFESDAGSVSLGGAGVGELVVAVNELPPFDVPWAFEATIAGRVIRSTFEPRPLAEQAIFRAEQALATVSHDASFALSGSLDSVRYLIRRLRELLSRGDADVEAQADEARELDRLADAIERGIDPYEGRTGPMRRALRSPIDGDFSEMGLYVPPSYKPGSARRFPLVVGLHGLNGFSMGVLRWLFGGDDPNRDQRWEERHIGTLPPSEAFVITPHAHGNSLYRELGEVDVLHAIEWASERFPIDRSRITITGPSMGGIGAAALPLHHPYVFAAAAPLCGYHSYFVRSDIGGRALRPWERFLAEERSNAMWAENGSHLPLWIVHGTRDLPEQNSGVLIDRYEKLGFSVKHEHPDAGHNVWQQTYEGLKGIQWLTARRVDQHPAHVRFKTTRTRWGTSAWVTVDELATELGWGEVEARANSKTKSVTVTTRGISQLTLLRDDKLFGNSAINVTIDAQRVEFGEAEPIVLGRETGSGSWRKGPLPHAEIVKHAKVTGPIRDVFSEPILFVYGDGDDALANEQVARAFAKIRAGVHVAYPVMSDTEFFTSHEPLANDRALFLVGRTNKVLASLERARAFPIHVERGAVVLGPQRVTGTELGAAFIHPNPLRPARYVVVIAGADVPGTLRALSLPDLLPDFVVWDAALAPARGGLLLGAGTVRAGGMFRKDWTLPATTDDPLALRARATKGG